MTPACSRPWWRLCKWCRSPWWRRVSLGRRQWRKGRGFLCRRRGPCHLSPSRRPAAACWTARTQKPDSASQPASRWSAPLPACEQITTTSWHQNTDAALCKQRVKHRSRCCHCSFFSLFVNGALVRPVQTSYISYTVLTEWWIMGGKQTALAWNTENFFLSYLPRKYIKVTAFQGPYLRNNSLED